MATNKVTLTFAGDSKGLEDTFDKVTSKTERTTTVIRESSGGFRDMQDRFDAIDQGAMGFRDTITGVQDGWKGITDDSLTLNERLLLVGTGVGDLASGFSNLIIPMASYIATNASAAATTVASWISMAASSIAGAASVAASWLIAFAPVIIVIAIVVGLAILIYNNWEWIKETTAAAWEWIKETTSAVWDGIMEVLSAVWDSIKSTVQSQIDLVKSILSGAWAVIKAITGAAWNVIKALIVDPIRNGVNTVRGLVETVAGILRSVPGKIRSALGTVASAITAPFRTGFAAIKDLWNSLVGGKGFSVPSWVPGVGGKEFRIPKLAAGGIALPRPGGHLVNVAEAGKPEAIIPLDRLGSFGGSSQVELLISAGGSALDQLLLEVLRKAIRNQGGGVIGVLG